MPGDEQTLPGDDDLVSRAKAGDSDAFGELYRRHMPATYRYIYYRVGNSQEAEDLTEMVYLRAWQALPNLARERLEFAAWVYRIARNAVIDHYRVAKRNVSLDSEEFGELAGEPGPDYVAAEEAARLRQALVALPDEQRDVIVLRFVEGLGHDQVAAVLGKSAGACRMIQHRALRALGSLLGGKRD